MPQSSLLSVRQRGDADSGRPRRLVSASHTQKAVSRPANPGFEPPIDVYETEEEVTVRLEIAGVDPKKVALVISEQGRTVSINGNRADPAAGQRRKYYHMEIECGAFARRIRLPVSVDETRATARYSDGFLVITLPKSVPPPPNPRSVPIE